MWVCNKCLRDDDTSSILPVSYGRCEVCGKISPCYDVTTRGLKKKKVVDSKTGE